MSYQGPNENVQSGIEQVQSGSERAQSHGQVQFDGGQAQSSSTSIVVQMLKNKNKPMEEIKPTVELEKSLESIRRFNQINEEIKESHDKQVTKLNNEKKICVSHCERLKQNIIQIKTKLKI